MKYRKRKKGFTLIEMLGVLILLAVIGIITVSGITAMIKGTNNKISDATTLLIEDAITDYISDKSDIYIRSDNAAYCINISDLIDNGNLTKQSISSLDESLSVIKVTFKNNKPVYEITDSCTENSTSIDFTLIGDKKINIEVGMGIQYEEPGASAYDDKGNIVSYTRTILDSKGNELINVDTNKIDIYTVRYSANIDGETYVIERYVNVRDTTKPIIIDAGVDTINPSATSFNPLEGITVTDNSSEVITPIIQTNLSLGVNGTYSITYTATDSSGNMTSYIRSIRVARGKSTMMKRTSGNLIWASEYRDKLITIDFVYYIDTTNAIMTWDLSLAKDNSIIGWVDIDPDNPSYYKLYIGSENEIMANSTCYHLFYEMRNVSSINFDNFNTSNVTDMNLMFQYTGYNMMTELDLGDTFDTSNVTNMFGMFYDTGYNLLDTLDLGDKFDTSKVTNMGSMFWYTGINVTSLDLGDKFDTSKVTNMKHMFHNMGYNSMTVLDLGDKFDTSNVTDMSFMFNSTGYTSMTTLNLGNNFNTSKVSDMMHMFVNTGYNAMTSLDLGDKFNTSKVADMQYMFYGVGYTSMTSLDLGDNFDTSSVLDMQYMFYNTGYTKMSVLDLGDKFNTSKVTNMNSMFSSTGRNAMTTLDLGENFDTSSVTSMYRMFVLAGYKSMISLDLGDKFDTSNVESMESMFENTGYESMTALDLGPLFKNIASANTDMFYNTGKSGCTIKVPSAIYNNSNATLKLNTSSTDTVAVIPSKSIVSTYTS